VIQVSPNIKYQHVEVFGMREVFRSNGIVAVLRASSVEEAKEKAMAIF